ncbi:MAG: cytochrome c biogenesis protein CcsA [Spirochaetia bacterium]
MLATTAFILILLSLVLQIMMLMRRREGTCSLGSKILRPLFLIPAFLLLADLVSRSFAIGYPALTNTFESLLFFSAAVLLVLFFVYHRFRIPPTAVFLATVTAAALLALASSPLIPSDMRPPIPALQSSWLLLHVSFSFIGEAFFVVAFASALVQLLSKNDETRYDADRITYISVAVGYALFTTGALVFGMVWAQQAWGRFWGWDPKETWALITWLTYSLYLHLRLFKGMRGRVSAAVAVIGFILTIFTFFGVNYLLPSLHSYV